MKIRALLVDDEHLAREQLRSLIAIDDDIELVAEAVDGYSAVQLIDQHSPDLVFLDIRLPGLSGIEVLEHASESPAIIFTTGFDQYAAAAFELEALDYLLKPFGEQRFVQAMDRFRRSSSQLASQLPALHERAAAAFGATEPLNRLFIRRNAELVQVSPDEITRIEACGDYVSLCVGGDTHLVHLNLKQIKSRMNPQKFLQVHRSHIVNFDHVASLRPHDDRRYVVRLDDGSTILASRAGTLLLKSLST
jgi:two-component system LytT family response regulator